MWSSEQPVRMAGPWGGDLGMVLPRQFGTAAKGLETCLEIGTLFEKLQGAINKCISFIIKTFVL